MKYISTRGQARPVDFESALLSGLAEDGGLYMPETWPSFSEEEIAAFADVPFTSIAFALMRRFLDASWSDAEIIAAINTAYADFDDPAITPLRQLNEGEYLLELFHGPTLSFKDIAMQLLARLFEAALRRRESAGVTIIAATSGDTGAAAIHGFRGMEKIDVFVLYPEGRISEAQRRQMTTPIDTNVYAIAIEGSFDDCQALVKQCFADEGLRERLRLTGVNSINWARIMAQTVYYLVAATRLGTPRVTPCFTVPTGNFGNIFAGYACARMGLPIAHLGIATNANDILARTLKEGIYQPRKVIATCAPSMDIQVASNFERLLFELSGRDSDAVRDWMQQLRENGSFSIPEPLLTAMRSIFAAGSASEEQIHQTIETVQQQNGMEIDPHTAVGVYVDRLLKTGDHPSIILSTAHPVKFPDARKATPDAPKSQAEKRIDDIMNQPERLYTLPASKQDLDAFLLQHSRLASR